MCPVSCRNTKNEMLCLNWRCSQSRGWDGNSPRMPCVVRCFPYRAPGKTRERGARSAEQAVKYPACSSLVNPTHDNMGVVRWLNPTTGATSAERHRNRGTTLALLVATPGSSGHVLMDTASRRQSTTIAADNVGAHCLIPSKHAARRSPMYADGHAPSETLSHPPHSDDESSASSTGGVSRAASSLCSIGKSPRTDKSSPLRSHPYPARLLPPMRRQGSSLSKDNQRLGELVKEHGQFAGWTKIAKILTVEGHGHSTGKQCRER